MAPPRGRHLTNTDSWRAIRSHRYGHLPWLVALALCTLLASNARGASGPAGHWKLDDGSGTSVADSSGSAHTGKLINTPTWTSAGRINGALTFGGTNAAVTVPGSGDLANLYLTGMTIAAWIKPTSAGGGGKGRIAEKTNWMLTMGSATTLEFGADNWTTAFARRTSSAAVTLNTWQHVAATWDGSQNGTHIHIYVNGALADGASVNGAGTSVSDASQPLTIGNLQPGLNRGFAGTIDDVRVYNRVLTAAEIQALANPVAPPGGDPGSGMAGKTTYQYDSLGRLRQVTVVPQ
jgi:hypothetical protein